VPHALGGSNRIETFLHPSFTAPGTAGHGEAAAQPAEAAGSHAVSAGEGEASRGGTATELSLMAVSVGVAAAGIGLAAFFFLRRRDLADAAARRWQGVYRLLLRQYYVDEVYDAGLVQPVKTLSEQVLWKGVDVGIIDGAVNGAAVTVRGASGVLRLLQSGSLRTYAASLFLGVLLILGYALWPR